MWEFYITQSPMHTAGAYSMQSIGWHDMACKCSTDQGLMVVHACHAPCKIYIYIYIVFTKHSERQNSIQPMLIFLLFQFYILFCFFYVSVFLVVMRWWWCYKEKVPREFSRFGAHLISVVCCFCSSLA